jgi:hypothetical protein
VQSEGRKPLRRHRSRREDTIKIDLEEIRCEEVDWIHLVQDRVQHRALVNTVINLWFP